MSGNDEHRTHRAAGPGTVVELRRSLAGTACALGVKVLVRLVYRSSDPYAVQLLVRTGAGEDLRVTLSREMLEVGLAQPCGQGQVHVVPGEDEDVVRVHAAVRGHGTIAVALDWDEVAMFLDDTLMLVPEEDEDEHLDWDATIAALLSGSN